MLPISILALVAPVVAVPLASFEGFGFKAFAEDGGWSARLDVTNQAGISEGQAVAEGAFPDLSGLGEFVLLVKSHTPQTFTLAAHGTRSGCFRAQFQVPASSDHVEVAIPLSSFRACSSTEKSSQASRALEMSLRSLRQLEVSATSEGAHLEVKSILARGSRSLGSAPPAKYNGCSHAVQPQLRFNISSRKEPTVPVPVDPTESLADAVCCDTRTKVYAEPQFLYEAPDIALFKHLSGVTTFYDSTCGLPLFKAPVNRTMADFEADTKEHGWPSFRQEEVISQHVTVDKDGFVYSSCGTHLGSYLPDSEGPRYCMDLSCIAGNPETHIIV